MTKIDNNDIDIFVANKLLLFSDCCLHFDDFSNNFDFACSCAKFKTVKKNLLNFKKNESK